jgi:hypothetical protein
VRCSARPISAPPSLRATTPWWARPSLSAASKASSAVAWPLQSQPTFRFPSQRSLRRLAARPPLRSRCRRSGQSAARSSQATELQSWRHSAPAVERARVIARGLQVLAVGPNDGSLDRGEATVPVAVDVARPIERQQVGPQSAPTSIRADRNIGPASKACLTDLTKGTSVGDRAFPRRMLVSLVAGAGSLSPSTRKSSFERVGVVLQRVGPALESDPSTLSLDLSR